MIWMTWRQFRVQGLSALAALVVLGGYLLVIGSRSRHDYNTDVLGCDPANCGAALDGFLNTYLGQFTLAGALLLAAPALIGIFWGAPLVTRELEQHTHRLVWNQSVTRRGWLAVKLGLLALFSAAFTGALSLLLTWSASRFDQVQGGRFTALTFAARNIVPLGYAVLAFVLGTVLGMLIRRTLPAMALTLVVFAVIQVLVPTVIRSHLMPPRTTTVRMSADVMRHSDFLGMNETKGEVGGYTLPGTWALSNVNQLFDGDGTPWNVAKARSCMTLDRDRDIDCMTARGVHFSYAYQPGNRYWPFQWIELSGFLVLAGLLAGVGFWRIRHQLG